MNIAAPMLAAAGCFWLGVSLEKVATYDCRPDIGAFLSTVALSAIFFVCAAGVALKVRAA